MKRIISLIIVIVASFMFTIPLSAAEKGIVKVDVYINGEKLQTTERKLKTSTHNIWH